MITTQLNKPRKKFGFTTNNDVQLMFSASDNSSGSSKGSQSPDALIQILQASPVI